MPAATIGFCRRHACHYKVSVQASKTPLMSFGITNGYFAKLAVSVGSGCLPVGKRSMKLKRTPQLGP